MPDDGYGFSGLDGEGQVTQNPVGARAVFDITFRQVAIREPDVIEFDPPQSFGALNHRGRNHLHGRVQQLEDAFACGHGRLQNVVLFAEVHDRTEEAQRVLDKRDQYPERCPVTYQAESNQSLPIEFHNHAGHVEFTHHVAATKPNDAGNRNRRENLDHRVVNRIGHDRVFVRVHVIAIDLREAVVGLALAIKKLQHHHAAAMFLQVGVDASDGDANTAVRIAHPVAKNLGGIGDKWEHSKGDQRQLPVHAQHHAKNSEKDKDIFKDGHYAGGEHLIQRIDVRGNARH